MQTVTDTKLPAERRSRASVTKQDTDGRYLQFIVPDFGYAPNALPPDLPLGDPGHFGVWRTRDRILLDAVRHEGQLANAMSIAIAKMASMSWAIDTPSPLRRKRAQELLNRAGAGLGVFSWVPFLSVGLRGFLSLGMQFIEIERMTKTGGGKIVALHNLNPLRCRLTGDPAVPVEYMDQKGKVHALKWYQVIPIIGDMSLDPETDGYIISAVQRCYRSAVKMAAIERYIYEKVSGGRAQSIYIVPGLNPQAIEDAKKSYDNERLASNLTSFGGAMVLPVPAGINVSVVEIPLASLPDNFNAREERERHDLLLANAFGLDPQDLNPAIIGRQGSLGSSGNQSQILADKQQGSTLASYKKQFVDQLNELLLDDKTLFSFEELDLRDRRAEAEIKKIGAETRAAQINSGELSYEEARNVAVENGELPTEYAIEAAEVSGGGKLQDDEKPGKAEAGRGERNEEKRPPADDENEVEKMVKEYNYDDLFIY